MTDIAITAANTKAGAGASIDHGVAGATITQGQALYYDADAGKWKLADADAATAVERGSGKLGIALNGASDGQPVAVHRGGNITLGGTLVAGTVYVLSATAGGICPQADLTTGDYVVVLGVATSTTVLAFDPAYSGVAT